AAPLSDIDTNPTVDPVIRVAKAPTTHAVSLRRSLAIMDRQIQQQHVHINLSQSLLQPIPAVSLNRELYFPGLLDGVPVKILIDTGCTGLLVSEQLIQQHPKFLKRLTDTDICLNFANKTQHESKYLLPRTPFSFSLPDYPSVPTQLGNFVVGPIHHDVILGLPWTDCAMEGCDIRRDAVRLTYPNGYSVRLERPPVTTAKFAWVSDTASAVPAATSVDSDTASAVPVIDTSNDIDPAISSIAVQQVQLMSKSSVDRTIRSSVFSGLINIKIDDKLAEDIKKVTSSDEIQELLSEYTDVFKEPTELPPDRP
ncbi:hypothetical protein HK104_008079, partial [Borealophlyctis nickersoniae]